MTGQFEQQPPATNDCFCHAAPRPQHGLEAAKAIAPTRRADQSTRTADHRPGGAPGWTRRPDGGSERR